MLKKLPKSFKVGGAEMEVRQVERCNNNSAGECCIAAGYIEIADKFDKCDNQSDGSKRNTFYHELTHAILGTMGKKDLNNDEEFVCTFSGFLCEAMGSMGFEDSAGQ